MIGYRKLLLAGVTVVLATLLTLFGFLEGSQWADTVTWLVGLYIGGNVVRPISEQVSKQMAKGTKE